jgi:hypothetical protein
MGVVKIDLIEVGTKLGKFADGGWDHHRDMVLRVGFPKGPVGRDAQDEVTDAVEA